MVVATDKKHDPQAPIAVPMDTIKRVYFLLFTLYRKPSER